MKQTIKKYTGRWSSWRKEWFDTLITVKKVKEYNCIRCGDNGCPGCDGTKGSKYNPEPF